VISEFVREQKRYSQKELMKIFHSSEDKTIFIIRRLKELGVLKTVMASDDQKNLSDLVDEDVEVSDVEPGDNSYLYVFTFVGVIVVAGCVLKCYPKYIRSSAKPLREMKQVLRVISKYNRSEEQVVNLFNGDAETRTFNLLAVILFLMNDYYNYGLYSNTETIREINGEGDILWGRTIDENFPVISDGRPYYMEMFTRRSVADETNYFHRLHSAVLTECSRQLEEAQLTELFDIEPLELTEDEISDFGEDDYILERISRELSVQFNTRKQILLKTMYAYIASERKVDLLDDSVSLYGTNAFNLIWEKVCGEVFSNMLQTKLQDLPLSCRLSEGYRPEDRLLDIIEKPKWYARDEEGSEYSHAASDTLIPDIVSIQDSTIVIFDAKYYNLHMEKDGLRGQPGIESVTKQYLYQLAYRSFAEDHHLTKFRNCFLMPAEGTDYIDKGYVEMKILHSLGLENIAVRLLPAEVVFDAYISGRRIDVAVLNL
jgi:DNA-binding Lrp family transcriptional regulator